MRTFQKNICRKAEKMQKFKVFRKIRQVKAEWCYLIPNKSSEFYQTYEFCEICYRYRKTSISNIRRRNIKCSFVVEYEDSKPVCIAPLAIDQSAKEIQLLGHGTNAGYLNFICGPETRKEHVGDLLNYCRELFIGYAVHFLFVPQESYLGELLEIRKCIRNYAIRLSSYQEYLSTLSKSTRQNIRTAYNRLNKDGKKMEFIMYGKEDATLDRALAQANEIYQKRRGEWGVDGSASKIRTAKILKRDVVYQTMRKSEAAVLAVLEIDGSMSGFFIGYQFLDKIYIPRLAIDSAFARYSPGILLILEYLKRTVPGHEFIFDLGRGDENYKIILGGG